MNKIHRTVWSQARGSYVVAHEHAGMGGKSSGSVRTAVAAALLALAAGQAMADTCATSVATALTTGCTVDDASTVTTVTGTGSITIDAQSSLTTPYAVKINNGLRFYNYGTLQTTNGGGAGINLSGGNITGYVDDGESGVNTSLANYGVIEVGAESSGLRITNGSHIVGSVVNKSGGGINAGDGSYGIYVNASNVNDIAIYGGIINEGTITVGDNTELSSAGIAILGGSTIGGYIANLGTIQVGSNDDVSGGIIVSTSTVTQDILNYGDISVATETNNNGRGNGSAGNVGIGVTGGAEIGSIENGSTGSIMVGNDGGSNAYYQDLGRGIFVEHSTLIGSIRNDGQIQAYGHAIEISRSAVGESAATGASIYNSGSGVIRSYSADWGDESGIHIYLSTLSGDIVNEGTIEGSSYGLLIDYGSAVSGDLINRGTIGGGTAAVYVESGSSLGAIHIQGDDTARFIGEVYSPASAAFVDADATYTLQNGNHFTVSGFTNNGTLKMDAGSTATITGNFSNVGTFSPTVAGDTDYSKLIVSGDVSLGGAAAVNVTATTLTAGGILTNVIQAGGTLSGEFSTITDNSYLYNFTGIYNSGSFDLKIVAAGNGDDTGGSGGTVVGAVTENGNRPAAGVARVLDSIVNGNSGTGADWSAVTTALGRLSTSGQVSSAASQTLPLLTGSSLAATHSALSSVNRVIQARIEGNRGLSSGDGLFSSGNVWFKPFGSWARQSTTSGVSGYKANTAGIAGGADTHLNDRANVGLAFAYAKAAVDGNSAEAPNSAKIYLFQLIGYGSYTLDATKELNWQVDVGHNNNRGSRDISFMGTTATSDYSSLSMHAALGLGWNFPISEKTTFLPSIRADYTRVKDEAYTESGAGVLNLKVKGRTSEQMLWSADAKIRHQLDNGVALSANAGVGYDSLNQRASMTAAFAGDPGASFVTRGVDPSPWIWHAGLGVSKTLADGVELTARYDAEHRTDFNNQTASLKVRWTF